MMPNGDHVAWGVVGRVYKKVAGREVWDMWRKMKRKKERLKKKEKK